MVERRELAVEVLTILGWDRGYIGLPAGGRLVDDLNTKPAMIALTRAVLPNGVSQPFVAIKADQVTAIRPQRDEA